MAGSRAAKTCGASVDRQLLVKTRMCKFFVEGKCHRGKSCTFAHSTKELHAPPDLFRSQLCAEFMETGGCRYGAACRFAHGVEQLRPPADGAGETVESRSQSDQLKAQLIAMRQRAKALEAQLEVLEGAPKSSPDVWQYDGDWSTQICWMGQSMFEPADAAAAAWDCWAPYVGGYGELYMPPEVAVLVPTVPWQLRGSGAPVSPPGSDCGACDLSTQPGADSDNEELSGEELSGEHPQVVVRNTFIEYGYRSAQTARRRARSAPVST